MRSTTRRGNGVGTGPAGGVGWGGPAKGAGSRKARKDLASVPGPGRGKFSIEGQTRKQQTDRRTGALMELLWAIAVDEATPTPVRIAAAVHLLNRLEGLPIQMAIAVPDELAMMTDDELAAEVRAFKDAVVAGGISTNSAETACVM